VRLRRFITAALMAGALALTATAQASAHARYDSSTPAKGEVLAASPAQVQVKFSQDVQKITATYGIEVALETGGGSPGAGVTAGPAVLSDDDRSIMSAPVQPNLPPGRYVVRWKNISDEDGDAAEGAFSFYVGVQPTETDLAADRALESIDEEETPQASPTGARTAPAATPPSASATATPATDDDDDDGGNTGLIVGIVVVVVLVAVAAGGAAVVLRRRQ
jgi:methionine-rich copper-binding protein CopC